MDTNEPDSEETVVIFRYSEDEVYALMPEDPADFDGRLCTCYQHIGQHSDADYNYCIATSRPATPEEYAPLAEELRRIGYRLKIRERATREHHARRRAAAREI